MHKRTNASISADLDYPKEEVKAHPLGLVLTTDIADPPGETFHAPTLVGIVQMRLRQ
jgi:hypothetical protein